MSLFIGHSSRCLTAPRRGSPPSAGQLAHLIVCSRDLIQDLARDTHRVISLRGSLPLALHTPQGVPAGRGGSSGPLPQTASAFSGCLPRKSHGHHSSMENRTQRPPDPAFPCRCPSHLVQISFRSQSLSRTRSHRTYNHHPIRRHLRTPVRLNFRHTIPPLGGQ